jgi:hypothetical protein
VLETLHVLVSDVPPILPQMSGNPVGAGQHCEVSSSDWIGVNPAAGVTDCRHVINVHTEA